jgi:hypothetical protein
VQRVFADQDHSLLKVGCLEDYLRLMITSSYVQHVHRRRSIDTRSIPSKGTNLKIVRITVQWSVEKVGPTGNALRHRRISLD